jgi:hypothetical protein
MDRPFLLGWTHILAGKNVPVTQITLNFGYLFIAYSGFFAVIFIDFF